MNRSYHNDNMKLRYIMNSLSSIHSQFLCEIVIQTKCMEKKNCSKCIQKLWKYVIYLEISKVKDSSVYHIY